MSVRETHIDIDFTADADPLRDINREINSITRQTRDMGRAYDAISDESSRMLKEMSVGWNDQKQSLLKYRNDLISAEYQYFKLAKGVDEFRGSNNQFLAEIKKIGAIHKKSTDQMMNNNHQLRQSIIRQAGTMMNLSTQASKISENYTRMNNPLYNINKMGLKAADGLERLANSGDAATLALKALGPNANPKQLNDYITTVNSGAMRFQAVALSALVASGILYTALTKAAMGPNPAEVRSRQTAISNAYKEAFAERVDEIKNFTGLFEKAILEPVKGNELTKALQSQVTSIKTWMTGLKGLTKKGVDEGLIKELQKAGPAAAMEIKALNSMSKSELDKYVALWKEKGALATEQTTSELAKLKSETDREIKELQNSLKPLGVEVEKMKKSLAKAFQPMVEVFSDVAVPIVKFITLIADLMGRFNEAHPTMAKMAQAVMMIIPVLTLILSPLAIGIGLFAGLRAALLYIKPVIMPLISGLGAMSATVWIVAAAIVGLVAGFIYMYNKFEWFRNGVNYVLTGLKNGFLIAFNFIKNQVIMPIVGAVVTFVGQKLAQLKAFWSQHGTQIMALVGIYMAYIKGIITVAMGVIKGVFQTVWPIITGIVKVAWGLIKLHINNFLSIIGGLIKAGLALIRGDWDGAWKAIKEIGVNIMNNIMDFFRDIDLFEIGKNIIQGLIKGIGSMVGGVSKAVSGVVGSIKKAFTNPLEIHSPSRLFMQYGVDTFQGYGIGMESQKANIQSIVGDMAAIPADYTPETSSTTNNSHSSRSMIFSPKITVQGSTGDSSNIKQHIKEAMEEAFDYLHSMYEVEEEY